MNLNYMRILIGLLLFLLVNGCTTQKHLSDNADKAYSVHAVFLEITATQLKELELSWVLDSSRLVSGGESDDIMARLSSSRPTRATQFPVVYLNEGEQKIIDKQRPVKFATAYNDNGRPTDYDTRGVGRLIEANLISVSNNIAELSYHIEDVSNPSWITYDIGTPPKRVKQPVFSSRAINPTTAVLPLNSWLFMGGLIRTLEDGSQLNLITAIQVKENKSPTTIKPRVVQGKKVPLADFISTRRFGFRETVPTLILCAVSNQTTMQAQ